MFKKNRNKTEFNFGVKYNPSTEDIDFTFNVNIVQENECDFDNQIENDEQLLIEEE